MRTLTIVGILMIAIGVIALTYEGITYTRRKTVLDIGPIEARIEERRTIPLPPVVGGLAVAGGIALVIAGVRPRTA